MGVVVTACSDGRPGIDTARADFEKRYPDATALEVRVSEDEVVARSFQMRYRVRSSGRENALEIQYMEDEAGRWVVRPEPRRRFSHDDG